MIRTKILLLATLLVSVRPVAAQELSFLETLFDQVNSFTFAAHLGDFTDPDEISGDCRPVGLCGLGTEVFINLHSTESILLELALGTSYLQGLDSEIEGMDFHAGIRSVPNLAIYTTHEHLFGQEVVQPFVGVSFGLAELWNARVYDDQERAYEVDAETFTQGVVAGVLAQISSTSGFFLQGGWERRNFFSLEWSLPDGVDSLPRRWPRELDMSSWMGTFGWQFFLPTER